VNIPVAIVALVLIVISKPSTLHRPPAATDPEGEGSPYMATVGG
jgi:hypothetical protein